MTKIYIHIRGVVAASRKTGPLTAGMVGVPVTFEFGPEWDGLNIIAVFRGSGETRSVPLLGTMQTVVPWEVMVEPNTRLEIGAEGRLSDGTVVIPTTWSAVGMLLPGANAADDLAQPPSPTAYDRIMQAIGDLSQLATDAKENLVEAINEAAQSGNGGIQTVNGVSPDENGNVEITISDSSQKVNPVAKTDDMTQPVGVDENGRLWVAPIGGGSGDDGGNSGGDGGNDGDNPGSPVDTSPRIAQYNMSYNASSISSRTGACTTEVYEFTPMRQQFIDNGYYNEGTGAVTSAGVCPAITFCIPYAKYVENGGSASVGSQGKMALCVDGVQKNYNSNPDPGTVRTSILGGNGSTLAPQYNGVAFSLYTADIDDSYAYWDDSKGTRLLPDGIRHGDIIFAGKNTSYYGMANIDGATGGGSGDGITTTSELSFDDDIAQNYTVATTSVMGDEPVTDTSATYGISNAFAEVITTVKKAWMAEYAGDYQKIPIIVSTDQHGRRNAGIFNLIGKTFSMHDISKVMNLGDTISEWSDSDTEKPLLSNSGLESWCESVKAIPFSKQLNVFGNHDTWYGNHDEAGNPIGTRYPSSQAHLNQYFRNIYARRTNNNGWFVEYDNQFNVKYVVISGYEYKDGSSRTRIGTEQMKFIIDEFVKDDGYDIIVVSHETLWQVPANNIYPTGHESSGSTTLYRVAAIDTDVLFNARKNKSSGTVTDSDGVEHSFDFSGCTTDILCGLHGHMHYDAYSYVGGVGNGLVNVCFDWFDGNVIHFVLVDRVNRQLNVWKLEGDALTYTNYQVPMDKPAE